MQINWFTVIAQLVNFLILVWLMKKYLYKPILLAIDEREKKIAAELDEAKSKVAEAKKEQDEFKKKNDEFDHHKKKMMDQAATDAESERQTLLDAAKKEATAVKHKLEQTAIDLQERLADRLAQKTQEQVLSITKKALSELASTNLEEQSVNVFLRNIKSMPERDQKRFIDAFHDESEPLSIKSAFDIPEEEQKSIEAAIAGLLGPGVKYEFKTDPKMMSGIELVTKGYKLSWSFAAYIDSLQKSMVASKKEVPEAVK